MSVRVGRLDIGLATADGLGRAVAVVISRAPDGHVPWYAGADNTWLAAADAAMSSICMHEMDDPGTFRYNA
jgi:hypothetical protein